MTESQNNPLDINGLIKSDVEKKKREQKQRCEMKFKEYLELLKNDPLIAQNSSARLLEAVLFFETETIPEEERWQTVDGKKEIDTRYKLFSDKLFGLDRPVAQMISYLKAGASRLSTGKQIMLLVGPTASGKSTIATLLKIALEKYNCRPVFAIKGCPIHEEPLHLPPRNQREEISSTLKVRISGDLCPVCRDELLTKFKEENGVVRWWDVPVETLTFSIRAARGIASFEPSDDKSSDITELTGRENIAVTSNPDRGYKDPHAYELSGELCKANRGIFEGRELVKADEKILWTFISVSEEQEVKIQGSNFPHIHIDSVLVGHTNLTEYERFSSEQRNEAMHDRIYTIPVPYPLRVKDEVRVYRKLIEVESDFKRIGECHIAPGALELGAMFAVMTRLHESTNKGISRLVKMKLYNGEYALTEIEERDKMPIDVRALMEEGQAHASISKREGMNGVSSRDVLAAINIALAREGNGCLTPLTVLRSLRNMFDHRMGYSGEQIDRFKEMLSASEGDSVMAEYKNFVLKTVEKAFLGAYGDLAKELHRKYLAEVEFERSQRSRFFRGRAAGIERDDLTGKPKEPDLKFMRSIERHVPVVEEEAEIFRGEILAVKASYKNPEDFNYSIDSPLARAIDKKLLEDNKNVLTLVLSDDKAKDQEATKRGQDLYNGLKEAGFCKACAREVMEKAGEFLRG